MEHKKLLEAYQSGELSAAEFKQKLMDIREANLKMPLSEGQKGLWLLHKVAPSSCAYYLPFALRLSNPDVSQIKRALNVVREQYPILTTEIYSDNGVPYQKLCPEQPLFFQQEDFQSISQLKEKVETPFPFEKSPLMRVYFFKPDLLLIIIHHLIFDGVSLMTFLSTFQKAYREKVVKSALPATYRDFIDWEKNLLASSEGQKHLDYWKKQLAGPLPVLKLPTDFSRPAVQTFKGATFSHLLSIELTQKAKQFARIFEVNLSVIFLGIFKLLLHHYSGQNEIIIGLPTLGRPEKRFKSLIGYYINMVSIRSHDIGKKDFKSFISTLQSTVSAALDHARYPFPSLVKQLNVERSQAHSPIFQAAFLYQNFFEMPDLELVQEIRQEGEFELSLEVYEQQERMILNLGYHPDLFQPETIERMMQHYLTLLEGAEQSYQTLLSSEEKVRFSQWNATSREIKSDKCLHELFEEKAALMPAETAISDHEKSLTYGEVDKQATALALCLQEKGVGPEVLVAICAERSIEMVVGVLGILKAGGAYVPIDPTHPSKRISQILDDSQVNIVVSQRQFEAHFTKEKVIFLDEKWTSKQTELCKDVAVHHLAYVMYTSGSTGKPKGVMVEHRNILNTLYFLEAHFPVQEKDVYLLKTNYIFDVSLSELFSWFCGKGQLVILPPGLEKVPQELLNFIEKHRVSHINFVPAQLSAFLSSISEHQTRLKYLMVAGEAFPKELVKKTRTIFPNSHVANIYGPTEVSIYATYFDCDDHMKIHHHTPIGKPIINTKVYVVDQYLQPVPIGVPGELCVEGEGVARGYWQSPELTAEKFVNSPFSTSKKLYKTGDLVRWLATGELEYLGRLDYQVKIRGFRIELGAVESHVGAHPKVLENVCIVKDKKLVSYYVAKSPLSSKTLRLELQEVLPDYMVPAHLIQIEKMPLVASGKINRSELENREINISTREVADSATTKTICKIWEELLHVKNIGIHDGFFDVGGDSLLAVAVVERIKQELSCKLTITDLFAYPTVYTLSSYLSGKRPKKREVRSERLADSVAIIGISCAFPGAKNLSEFWDLLKNGKEGVRFFEKDELQALGVPNEQIENPHFVPALSSIEGKEHFDSEFFQISAKDAELMDPQMRLLLQHAWKAVEDGGYRASDIPETSVYMSASHNAYQVLAAQDLKDGYLSWILSQSGTIPTMISHKLGFKGPSYAVHSNCSSSLVGLYTAYQSLQLGESNYALVGASTLHSSSQIGYIYRPGMNFSSDGHVKAFDAKADGMLAAEGVAVVLLKKTTDAVRDNDSIYAVLKGIALNNDGADKAGFYAPSVQGQCAVIKKALEVANVDARSIDYVEAHGTGTKIGDPIELAALQEAYQEAQVCGIGSVKTNLGHLDTAAGLAGCIKVALSLSKRELTASINFTEPNPNFNFEDSPFYVVEKNRTLEGDHHYAALSSFGIGGTNVHAIFESHNERTQSKISGPYYVPVSAKNEKRLHAYVEELLTFTGNIADLAYTFQMGRQPFAKRILFVVDTVIELKEQLKAYLKKAYISPPHPWLEGEEFDWKTLYSGAYPNRIHAPTYPFAQNRYWPSSSQLHPMVHSNTSTADRQQFRTVFSGKESFIAEHVIEGETIVPAVVTLEMARVALVAAGKQGSNQMLCLKNIAWAKPIVIDSQSTEIKLNLIAQENGQIRYQMHGATLFNQGSAEFGPIRETEIIDLHVIQMRCSRKKIESKPFYEGMLGAQYGPSYRVVQKVYLGEGELLAELKSTIDETYVLHPSQMDGAFQVAEYLQNLLRYAELSAQGKAFQAALPFALDEMEIFKPCSSHMWVHVKANEKNQVALTLCDEKGEICIQINGFTIRSLQMSHQTHFFKPLVHEKSVSEKGIRLIYELPEMTELEGTFFDERPKPLATRFISYGRELLSTVQKLIAKRPQEETLIQLIIPDHEGALGGLLGLLKTAHLENSKIVGQLIRVKDKQLKLQEESWDEVEAAEQRIPWKKGGVYLIAGGGKLGELFAKEITKHGGIPILASRTSKRVMDVTDSNSVKQVVEAIVKEYGQLNGVIHAAGVIKDHYIHDKSADELEEVLSPKVKGVVNLDEATQDLSLDFFILFSSLSGSVGGIGQADYAMANAFLDGYAATRNILSINWPLWKEGGMQVDAQTQKLLQSKGMVPIDSKLGIDAFYRTWHQKEHQLMLLYGESQAIRQLLLSVKKIIAKQSIVGGSVKELLREEIAKQLKIESQDVEDHVDMAQYGFDSIAMIEFVNNLNEHYQLELTPTLFFEHPTLQEFSDYLSDQELVIPSKTDDLQEQTEEIHGVAIIGMSGLFPMANDIEAFWHNLEQGKDCIREIPADRWDWRDYETDVRWGGFVDSIAEFDPLFFGISPRDATIMDPQQRLLMMHVYKSIEDAGYAAKSLAGTKTGVFVGTGNTGYNNLVGKAATDGSAAANMSPSAGPNRISYFLDIHGPSEPIDTACSSSLVAIHHAVNAIENGSCEMAFAGGVNSLILPEVYITFDKAGALSKEGRCKTFSDRADGFAHGEGIGILLLKSLNAAQRDGDHIYGVIRGTAVNHGGHATSLTTPNPKAQTAVLKEAYQKAQIDPSTVSYIEAHGTGTELGDPVEISGLKSAFQIDKRVKSCGIGSVKTNIGHLSLAAGIAGVIKVLLQMQHKTLVKSLHCENVNPYIQLEKTPFYIVQEKQEWRTQKGQLRRAGVSSFGIGGVNAHVVIEEYPSQESVPSSIEEKLIILSAKNQPQLQQRVQQLLEAIEHHEYNLSDLAYTLQVGRDAMEVRFGFIAHSLEDIKEKLKKFEIHQVSNVQKIQQGNQLEYESHKKLLELWLQGYSIDWKRLYKQKKCNRISLPTYPFKKDRYWAEAEPEKAILHPLLHRNTSDLERQRFTSSFTGREFFLNDHKIKGEAVLPGVAHLEMARTAFELAVNHSKEQALRLKNCVWIRPIRIEGNSIEVELELTPQKSGEVTFEVQGYSQGQGQFFSYQERPKVDIKKLQAVSLSSHLFEEVYKTYRRIGFDYGSTFRAVKQVEVGENFILAQLSLESLPKDFVLHPGIMDSALQASSLLLGIEESSLMLPFALDEIEIYGPCSSKMWVYAQLENQQRRSIALCDSQGNICVQIKGLSFRPVQRQQLSLYKPLVHEKSVSEKGIRLIYELPEMTELEGTFFDERPKPLATRFISYGRELLSTVQKLIAKRPQEETLIQLIIPDHEGALGGLLGLLKTAHLENSKIVGQLIRVKDKQLKLQEESWDEVEAAEQRIPWKKGGVYLIAGGGKLGELFAKEITKHGGIPILASRTSKRVMDVTDSNSVKQVVEAIVKEYGQLNGVIHAAGVIKDHYIHDKSADELEEVLSPKVKGVVNLDEATQDLSLDFFILFSSLSGSVGGIGQADYAMANAFLDGYAATRNMLSINWPLWKEGGMQVDAQTQKLLQSRGVIPLETDEGIEFLYQAYHHGGHQLMVVSKKPEETDKTAITEDVNTDASIDEIKSKLVREVSKLLEINVKEINPDKEFNEYGFDSITLTEFSNRLNELYQLTLTPTIFFEYPTLRRFADYLAKEHQGLITSHSPLKLEPRVKRFATPQKQVSSEQPIAIIGMSGLFPMANDLETFWSNLQQGRDCITEIPRSRWDWRDYQEYTDVKWGGFVDSISEFDPLFFGISPREAALMDPQQRLLMTYVWKAIEDAGYSSKALAGTNTGIFVGTGNTGYSELLARANSKIDGTTAANMSPSSGPNRMSYLLDIHGPSEPIDTACSSSLVAIHHAVCAIRDGSCEMALAGGVNTVVAPEGHIAFDKAGALSKEGRCKTFSDQADGFAVGEGAGILLLKRLAEAERDGDHIYGLIRGSAVNHGGHANSLTAPNPKAQADLLIAAYKKAEVDPKSISYIEAHGTGTELGDPIEINGLKSAFKDHTMIPRSCGLGSVKTNIGHLSLAAGVAGVIKVLLQLKHKTLVKSLHSKQLNPYIQLDGTPFYIVQETQEWKTHDGLPRRAGVSSFGIGGVNAHIVLEEYIAYEQIKPAASEALIVLSAKNKNQLKEQVEQLRKAIEQNTYELVDIAYTLQVGRDAMEKRLAFVATSIEDLRLKLKNIDQEAYVGEVENGTLQELMQDEEMQEAIEKWMQRKKYARLLDLWVQGLNIPWKKLYPGQKPKRISLPTYPFAKEHYWIESGSAKSDQIHPLIHRNTSDFSQQSFSSTFSGSEFFFTDHCVQQACILPAVAYLEMAREAFTLAVNGIDANQKIIIKNVVWMRPMSPSTVETVLTPQESGEVAYSIGDYHQGKLELLPLKKENVDLATALAQCTQGSLSSDDCYTLFQKLGVEYGPGHQVIKEIHLGLNEVVAELSLPPDMWSTLNDYVLHPSLMDGALQAVIGLMFNANNQEFSLPFALEEVEVLSSCCPKMWVHIRRRLENKMQKLDFEICDEHGALCVRIKGLVSKVAEAHTFLLTPVWNPIKTKAVTITPDIIFAPKSQEIESSVELKESVEEIVEQLKNHQWINHLVWIAPTQCENTIAAQDQGVLQLFRLIKSLILLGYHERRLNWSVITRQTQSIYETDSVDPDHAAVHGLIGSMAKEYPSWSIQLIDLEHNMPIDLASYPIATSSETYAFRHHQWHQQSLIPVHYKGKIVSRYQQEGVYVVIGGAGGIGEVWTEYMIRHFNAHVVWIGRRKKDVTIQDKIDRLETLGPRPLYIQANATNLDEMQRAYGQIKEFYPTVNGVIHAAIILKDQSLLNMEEANFKRVLDTKVATAVHMAQVFKNEKLDFVLFFSSMQSFAKAAGQSNYAAGCTFKDAYAHFLNRQWNCPVKIINWGYWGSVGIVASKEYQQRMAKEGVGSIQPQEAMETLEKLLGGTLSQIVLLKTTSREGLAVDESIEVYSDEEAVSRHEH